MNTEHIIHSNSYVNRERNIRFKLTVQLILFSCRSELIFAMFPDVSVLLRLDIFRKEFTKFFRIKKIRKRSVNVIFGYEICKH